MLSQSGRHRERIIWAVVCAVTAVLSFFIGRHARDRWSRTEWYYPQPDSGGFVDVTGNSVIPMKFESARPFVDALAAVCIGNKYGFVDLTGRMVIQPRFEDATAFYEGLASVKVGGKYGFCLLYTSDAADE